MNYIIISGSHRENSQSEKVSKWLEHQLQNQGEEISIVNLAGNPFPLWSEDAWNDDSELSKKMVPILDLFKKADGIIIVSPEWSGMVPGGLKNFLLYLDPEHVGHKPTLLVGVSASRGGSYPIAELRMSGYKNSKMVYIPDHLIVQNVKDVMNDMEPTSPEKADGYIRERALFSLGTLGGYTAALKPIRTSDKLLNDKFEYGM